ncbi:hypothetical protein ACMAY7_11145 [Rhodobacteraceae bacterium nBUS_24]|jgi:deoxyribose-phosphate aldolase
MLRGFYSDPRIQAFAGMFHFGCLGEEKTLEDGIAEAKRLRASGLNIEAYDCEVTMLAAARDILKGYCKLHVPVGYPGGNVAQSQKLHQLDYLLGEGIEDSCYCLDYADIVHGNWQAVEDETRQVMDMCRGQLPMAIVIQATLLDDRQIVDACKVLVQGGANRVKMNTGYGWGTSKEEVDLVYRHFNGVLDIHPSGNIRTLEQVDSFMDCGVAVIHSMAVIEIVDEFAIRLGLADADEQGEVA